ncbi:hypothetical protein BJ944DRAFT_264443 [Cunninghamella echinulata]|nr:hypothetical protein BJ944DRAFT_264443 [Cunninghamella echinulata]
MVENKKLTKKEKKALAFREKQKKKSFSEESAVPESDIIEDQNIVDQNNNTDQSNAKQQKENNNNNNNKKRKLDNSNNDKEKSTINTAAENKEEEEQPAKKKVRRGKGNNNNNNGSRFIVFVGNLPFNATKEEIEKHFESVGGIVSVRLLTDKVTKKPKGFAFVEFETSKHLNKALGFHHTLFKKRQINVELTAGGGGKSEARNEKLKKKNERLTEERVSFHKNTSR